MENATLDICLDEVDEYINYLNRDLDNIINQNFKRIMIHINENEIMKLYGFLNRKNIKNGLLILIYSNIHERTEFNLNDDNIILVNTNEKNIIKNEKVFNLIILEKNNINLIAKLIKSNVNVIVNPIININNISEFFNTFDSLTNLLNGMRINLNGYMIPSFLMREHPCNAYLCDGCHCKKKISCLPKYITINNNYDVYPHDLFYDKLKIGNVKNIGIANLLEQYYNEPAYSEFIKYNKIVFIKYLSHYPYQFMPIIEYIKEEINNDK